MNTAQLLIIYAIGTGVFSISLQIISLTQEGEKERIRFVRAANVTGILALAILSVGIVL